MPSSCPGANNLWQSSASNKECVNSDTDILYCLMVSTREKVFKSERPEKLILEREIPCSACTFLLPDLPPLFPFNTPLSNPLCSVSVETIALVSR